jgi:hypothetical protein
MARPKAARRTRPPAAVRKRAAGRSSAKRKAAKKGAKKRPTTETASARVSGRKAARVSGHKAARVSGPKVARVSGPKASSKARPPAKVRRRPAQLDRERRTLADTVPMPPSSLDMNRHGSAARTGREELAESRREHRGMSPEIAGGDLDVNVEDAYFTGEASPGGDNPTPDQDVVDDIARALGVEYEDSEELKASDKVTKRDKHRWELDPASSEDYKDRK